MHVISKEVFLEKIRNPKVQKRFSESLSEALLLRGPWPKEIGALADAVALHAEIHRVNAEQALHGRPTYRYLEELCHAFNIDLTLVLEVEESANSESELVTA